MGGTVDVGQLLLDELKKLNATEAKALDEADVQRKAADPAPDAEDAETIRLLSGQPVVEPV